MNAHTWYKTQGDATNSDITSGTFTQMMEKPSIGSLMTRTGGLTPIFLSASTAGARTISQSWLANTTHSRNAIPKPCSARIIRWRISSRCSRNDMRSMPPSSPSSSSGGGGRLPPEPPAPKGTRARSSGDSPPSRGVSIPKCKLPRDLAVLDRLRRRMGFDFRGRLGGGLAVRAFRRRNFGARNRSFYSWRGLCRVLVGRGFGGPL